jgi:hypothetical protein
VILPDRVRNRVTTQGVTCSHGNPCAVSSKKADVLRVDNRLQSSAEITLAAFGLII